MKFLRKLLARNRIRAARRELAKDPSPRSYAVLAREYAQLGLTADVVRVCEEGLEVFPGNSELSGLRERAQRLEREARLAELKRELAEAPRPALWNELCEMNFESGRPARAEEAAKKWLEAGGGPEARLMVGRCQVEIFFADRGREQGREAFRTLEECLRELGNDPRPLRLMLKFAGRIGAWKEARRCAGQLLQLAPGEPVLEARFRKLDTMADTAPTVSHALIEVERTGRFADEGEAARQSSGGDVRPMLRELAADAGVQAALYIRGSTVLVQGPKGATAELTAKGVRSVLSSGRAAGRRLGLGHISQIQLEGDFGTLAVAPGELDAGALWTRGPLSPACEKAVMGLGGMNADVSGVLN